MSIRFYLISIFFSICVSEVEGWNSTTFEYLWNRLVYSNQFRTNIETTPFELRISQLNYFGAEYNKKHGILMPWDALVSGDTSIVILNQSTVSIPGLTDSRNLRLTNIEIDFYRVNYLKNYINKNFIDFQHGLTWNYMEADFPLSLPGEMEVDNPWTDDCPLYHWCQTPDPVSGVFKYSPAIHSFGINNTVSWKPLNYLQLTAGIFMGYAYGSLYKSTGGDSYLSGDGLRISSSLDISFVLEDKKKNLNYLFGVFSQIGKLSLDKLSDSKYGITPISGFEIYTAGIGFSAGIQFGGKRTYGDRGYRKIIEDDYLHAIDEFVQFVQFHPDHPRIDKAKELIEICKSKIPIQAYINGVNALERKQYAIAGEWMQQAVDANDISISTLAEYKLDKMASMLIDSVRMNLKELSIKEGEILLLLAMDLSDEYNQEAKILRGEIYLTQGDILLSGAQYLRALEKYNQARKLSPSLKYLVKEKEKTLARALLLDAERGIQQNEQILVIESLRISRELYPEEIDAYDALIYAIENIKK